LKELDDEPMNEALAVADSIDDAVAVEAISKAYWLLFKCKQC